MLIPGAISAINWKYEYERNLIETPFMSAMGEPTPFQTATLNLPKLITREWTIRQIGERPKVLYEGLPISHYLNDYQEELDYHDLISKLFAYGRVIVVPYINSFDEFSYIALPDYGFFKFQVIDNKISELVIKSQAQWEYFHYQLDHNSKQYIYRKLKAKDENPTSMDDFEQLTDWYTTMLEPFFVDLQIDADKYAIPVWGGAMKLINDADRVYHEMQMEMNLNRTIVAIPKRLENQGFRSNGDEHNVPYLFSNHARAFQYVPNLPDEYNEIKQFGGKFNPTPYIDQLDMLLSQIGVLCGLGKNTLVFREHGVTSLRGTTATEILYQHNSTYINQKFLNNISEQAIQLLESQHVSWLTGKDVRKKDIVVTIQDNLANDEKAYQQKLMEDFKLGVISKEFYLSQRYPDELIEDITSDDVQEKEEVITESDNIQEEVMTDPNRETDSVDTVNINGVDEVQASAPLI